MDPECRTFDVRGILVAGTCYRALVVRGRANAGIFAGTGLCVTASTEFPDNCRPGDRGIQRRLVRVSKENTGQKLITGPAGVGREQDN